MIYTTIKLFNKCLGIIPGLCYIIKCTNGLQDSLSILGVTHSVQRIRYHQRKLGNIVNFMASRLNQCWQCRCRQSRRNSVSALVHTNLSVPSSPNLCGAKHSTTSAHITESTLSRTRCSATRDTRNTSYGTTSTP